MVIIISSWQMDCGVWEVEAGGAVQQTAVRGTALCSTDVSLVCAMVSDCSVILFFFCFVLF